jgi:hypothetical protein
MAMGERKSEQTPISVPTTECPVSAGDPFYATLNTILDEAGSDRLIALETHRALFTWVQDDWPPPAR